MSKKASKGAAIPRLRSDGYWECRWTDILTTGEKKVIVVTGKTEQEVVEKRDKIKLKIKQNQYVNKNTITLSEWVRKWLYDIKKIELEPKTWCNYESLLRVHIIPEIGDKQLQKITTNDIQNIINMLAKKLSPVTVKKIQVILSMCFKQAKLENYISSNVVEFVKLPKLKKIQKKKPFTDAEIVKLIEVAINDPANKRNPCYYPILVLFIETGARMSEILGLKWENVFLQEKKILIKDTVVFVSSIARQVYSDIIKPIDGTSILPKDTPKTDKSIRLIPISDYAASILSSLERRGEYVFSTKNGTPISQRNWARKLLLWMERAGIKDHSTHDFRHTFITDLIDANASLATIQSLTGHSSPRILTETYMHSVSSSQIKAMQQRQQKLYQTIVSK